ncbi:hypothetical protein BDV38DRAFT_266739 [Aspergillus pseudotamarii]|uniref:Uncharacterized protein n=1 Tax=Aspergillus pseudotamarii TaxID=132259 RepID=A0A5N6S9J9_ASPPS|nr:uncharacterized protein BDV38DRAFT_266739 [Aspergillus pseudotamarii]KAE8130657.1 hypothetical protein BDV38DRAFT_266739 [Aspergillus pseudotamarii]
MKASVRSELLFYREQTIANLRFLFGEEVDVLTCTEHDDYNAIACRVKPNGERVPVLQASSLSAPKALEKLHDMSIRRVGAYLTEHKQMRCEGEYQALQKYDHFESVQAANRSNLMPESNCTHTASEESQNRLSQISVRCDTEPKGYSVLVAVQYPFKYPLGELRYLSYPNKVSVLDAAARMLRNRGISTDAYPITSLSIRKEDCDYDILGYGDHHLGDLLDDVRKMEKVPTFKCIYSEKPLY